MDAYILIISLSFIIIISHFLNIYSENTGVPSVLILILFGALLQLDTELIGFEILDEATRKPLLKVLGVAGLILILLEAALELKINKKMIVSSSRAFFVGLFGLILTSFSISYILQIFVTDLDIDNPLTTSQIFYLDVRLSQDFILHTGNNLISYLGVLENNSIENMLLPLSGNVSQIITENYASIQLEDGSWIGSIDSIETTKGYWLRLDDSSDYSLSKYQTPQNQISENHLMMSCLNY